MREAPLVGRRVRGCQLTRHGEESGMRRRPGRWAFVLAIGFALLASASVVRADSAGTYFYREGPDFPVRASRPGAETSLCSFREPVCVHADAEVEPSTLRPLLEDLEHVRRSLRALDLPPPLLDGALGGSPAFDLYWLDRDASEASIRTERDELRVGELDRASAFAILKGRPEGCARRNLLARALGSAIGFRLDAAESPAIRESRAAYFAELVAPCDPITRKLVDDFQRHPERAIFSSAAPQAGLLFPWFLDTSLGTGFPLRLPFALTAISQQRTPLGSFTFRDEPDLFDALRESLAARTPPRRLSDLLLDFAIARAFVGDRDDGQHLPETRWLGKEGRVRFEWAVPFASLPRTLAPAFPIEPTGASYLWVDLEGAPTGARITFRAKWEPPVLFRWGIVRVRKDGTEASRVVIPAQDGATEAVQTVEEIDSLAGLLIVGTNAGDIGLARPFDPDEQPAEPHGYEVTIWGE